MLGLVKILLMLPSINKVDITFVLEILCYPVMQDLKAGLSEAFLHFRVQICNRNKGSCVFCSLSESHEVDANQTSINRSFITPLTTPKKNLPEHQITLSGPCELNLVLSSPSIFCSELKGWNTRVMDLLLSTSFKEQVYRFQFWLLSMSSDFIPTPDD